MPKRHKTLKEARKIQEKKKKRELREREEEFQRNQRDIYRYNIYKKKEKEEMNLINNAIFRIPEILETIEAEDNKTETKAQKRKANKEKRFDQPFTADGKKYPI